MSYADDRTRLFAPSGRVAHLRPPFGLADVLCGRPEPEGGWLGTGNQAEHDRAAGLPACRRCGRRAALDGTSAEPVTGLGDAAKTLLREHGISTALWARANWYVDGGWGGDSCGCPDDRCIGHHHDAGGECGCLRALLADFTAGKGTGGMFDPAALPPVRRPYGGFYRPRKLTVVVLDEYGDEEDGGIAVFGTHNEDVAGLLADEAAVRLEGAAWHAADPVRVWWRDGYSGGRRCWVTDELAGRAGVLFRRIEETTGEAVGHGTV